MKEKALYYRSYILYDCALDPDQPCSNGRIRIGSCGEGIVWKIVKRSDKYIALRCKYEYNMHSVNINDHTYSQTPFEEIADFNSLEEAIKFIEFIRKWEEFKPDRRNNFVFQKRREEAMKLTNLTFERLAEMSKEEIRKLVLNSTRKELLNFIEENHLFIYGRKKDKRTLQKTILSWVSQHRIITGKAL